MNWWNPTLMFDPWFRSTVLTCHFKVCLNCTRCAGFDLGLPCLPCLPRSGLCIWAPLSSYADLVVCSVSDTKCYLQYPSTWMLLMLVLRDGFSAFRLEHGTIWLNWCKFDAWSFDARLNPTNNMAFLAMGGAWNMQVVADLPGLVQLETAGSWRPGSCASNIWIDIEIEWCVRDF